MPLEMLKRKDKLHRKNCRTHYEFRLRIAITFINVYFGVLIVYLLEKYYVSIPYPVAMILVIALVYYLIYSLFSLALLDKKDTCRR